MKDLTTTFENYRCLDRRTGESIGIVLETEVFSDLETKSYLWSIEEGVIGMLSFVGEEIENIEASSEPVTMQDIVHNASLLFSRWHELENVDHEEFVVANHQRSTYIRKIPDLMNANGLASEFNLCLLKICLASFFIT